MRVRRIVLPLALAGTLLAPLSQEGRCAETAFSARQRAHWAFHPPARPAPPRRRDPYWIQTPVDAFILARLDEAGLRPAARAGRAVLLRRVTFDLIGLPPTPRQLDDFLKDTRPDAYVRIVERLLASPHYGERWAQHWLDVVRYAESNGYEADAERLHAWRYRDYVVNAFNEDKPYDRFLTEQLAGDLLFRKDEGGRMKDEKKTQNGFSSSFILHPSSFLIAAGFNRCGPVHQTSGNVDPNVGRQEELTEMTNGVGAAFLGLTVACARCHNHKFDPFTQADYYALQAFFHAAQAKEVDLATAEERGEYDRRRRELDARLAPLRQQLQQLEEPYRRRLTRTKKEGLQASYRAALDIPAAQRTAEQRRLAMHAEILIKVTWDEIVAALSPADRERRTQLRKQLHALEARKPSPPPKAWTILDKGGPLTAPILKRGDPHKPGETVRAGFPRILNIGARSVSEGKSSLAHAAGSAGTETPDRLTLAAWMTRTDHPLTARVVVNRLWQHHFGRGLVATPNDFGMRGAPPTHPELLDWLACELMAHGWSLKHLHRLMVLSATYQQESRWSDPRGRQLDPDNRLLARMNRRRLEGEALRDSALAAAGNLNPALGGPHVRVPLEPEVQELIFTEGEPDGLWPVTPDARQHARRGLYLFNKRNVRLPLFEAFDRPDTLTSCPVRSVSTFAPQALILLNGPFLRRQAAALAISLLRETPSSERDWIVRGHRLSLSRDPNAEEMRMAEEFLREQSERIRDRLRMRLPVAVPEQVPPGVDPAMATALADFCLALLNRNEFLYID